MPKYMLEVSYTAEGVKGLLKDGATGRRAAAAQMAESLGGSLESIYYAFGENDAFVVFDLPGNVDAAAMSMRIAETGAAVSSVVVLLTPEEVDEAAGRKLTYRPPGA